MKLHFTEKMAEGIGLTVEVRQTLCLHQSKFQEIMILETAEFGRMMVLDGCVMLTERDEYLYHEMLVHPAACSHTEPKKALVVGGGDGGTVRELLRYPSIESVDLVEIDGDVIRLSREYLPALSACLDDPKVTVHVTDGVAFLNQSKSTYDLIMVDSTDPVGPAEGLISQSFYTSCREALAPGGIMTLQSESPMVHSKDLQRIYRNLSSVFSSSHLYHGPVTAYPSGWWSFAWASESGHPLKQFHRERAIEISQQLHYYNEDIHFALFAQPNFIRRMLKKDST